MGSIGDTEAPDQADGGVSVTSELPASEPLPKTHWDTTDFTATIPWSDRHFLTVLEFYLFESPAANASARGSELAALGWGDNESFAVLKHALIQAATEGFIYKACDTRREVVEVTEGSDGLRHGASPATECAVFHRGSRKTMDSLFAHVRNAFAHGRFVIRTDPQGQMYFLEDQRGGVITARLALRQTTLLEWADIARTGPVNSSA